MNKILAFALLVIMVFSLCACESKEERALREANNNLNNAQNNYNNAVNDYNNFNNAVDDYRQSQDKLNSYK